ncbi:MAG: hypothetical protein WAW61_12345 [Methylococcaceae bacterium]
MQNKFRFESLRILAPIDAVEAWLSGDSGIGDEPALIDAISEAVCDAMAEGLDAQECIDHMTAVS